MYKEFFATMKRLTPSLLRGDLETCEREVEKELLALPTSPFHIVLDLSISNNPKDAAKHFDGFFEKESRRFPIRSAYTEMNGFAINPDRWFCDAFAYKLDIGVESHDGISDWQSDYYNDYTIFGLEKLQNVYASTAFQDKANGPAVLMCSLMVVVKFQQFIGKAAREMTQLRFPLYVTAHDFDFIASFRPNK